VVVSVDNRRVTVALGEVSVPSGVFVLAMAGWVDTWPDLGRPLSERAAAAAANGGAHLHEWLCEAIAVPTATGVLPVSAIAQPAVWDPVDTIAVLEVDLGLPWTTFGSDDTPVLLGDLPVDRCGMVLGDAAALDSWVGFMKGEPSIDGLADLSYHGKDEELVRHQFGGERLLRHPDWGPYGWRDLPIDTARERRQEIQDWVGSRPGCVVVCTVKPHTHYYLGERAGWEHPLRTGTVEVAGCPALFIAWDEGEHSMRHRGEPAYGQVYPATVEPNQSGLAVMRWTIPPTQPDAPHTTD
jgi:hypothetical protein